MVMLEIRAWLVRQVRPVPRERREIEDATGSLDHRVQRVSLECLVLLD